MRNLKILGLSLLALVGVMAVSASAAQAKWLLLKNGQSVLLLEFNVDAPEGELLAPELGVAIHCDSGGGSVHVDLSSDHKILLGTAILAFNSCSDLNFGEVCTVRGAGDSVGTITATGEGNGSMEGERVLVDAEASAGEPFADVVYEGEECPLVEIDGKVFGSVEIEVLNPLNSTTTKTVEVTDQDLRFGSPLQPAELHDSEEGNPTATIEEVGGANFGVHLVGL